MAFSATHLLRGIGKGLPNVDTQPPHAPQFAYTFSNIRTDNATGDLSRWLNSGTFGSTRDLIPYSTNSIPVELVDGKKTVVNDITTNSLEMVSPYHHGLQTHMTFLYVFRNYDAITTTKHLHSFKLSESIPEIETSLMQPAVGTNYKIRMDYGNGGGVNVETGTGENGDLESILWKKHGSGLNHHCYYTVGSDGNETFVDDPFGPGSAANSDLTGFLDFFAKANSMQGELMEIVIWVGTNLTLEQRTDIQLYVSKKWGVQREDTQPPVDGGISLALPDLAYTPSNIQYNESSEVTGWTNTGSAANKDLLAPNVTTSVVLNEGFAGVNIDDTSFYMNLESGQVSVLGPSDYDLIIAVMEPAADQTGYAILSSDNSDISDFYKNSYGVVTKAATSAPGTAQHMYRNQFTLTSHLHDAGSNGSADAFICRHFDNGVSSLMIFDSDGGGVSTQQNTGPEDIIIFRRIGSDSSKPCTTGVLKELLVYSDWTPSNDKLQAIYDYLNLKYGLSLVDPVGSW